jgi:predicted acetyltransferase
MSDRYVGGLRVAAPEPSLHLSSLARLVAVTFWGGEDESTLATVGDALRPGGSYRWLGSRIGLTDDGHIATHAGLVDFHMRVGEHAQLRTAGLCAILTAEEFRLRGWMRQTMNDLLTNLPAAGYDISLLFGVDEFYQQFDYRRAWPEHRFEMDLADLVQAPDVKLEFFEHEQPDEVVALANRHEQGQTGSVVREGGWFTKLVEDRGCLWRGADGNVAGYILTRVNDEQLLVTGHAGGPDAVLGVIHQLMQSHDRKQVRLGAIAPECELAKRLRRMNSKEVIQHQRCGGALLRLVNLRSTLLKLLSDLRERLQNSALSGWNGDICFDTDDEVVDLRITDGEVEVVDSHTATSHEVSGPGMAQLLIGTDDVDALMAEGSLSAKCDGARLARVLFPATHPSMPEPDHF